MNISEKAAYIKGLAEGLSVDQDTKEGKIIAALIDVVGDMAEELQRLNDYIEEIDECLGDVEDYLVDEMEDCDCDCDCDDCDCDCDDCDCDCDCDDCDCDGCEEFFEAECPNCHETFEIDADELDDDDAIIVCPHCNQKLVFDDEELGEDDED